MSVNKPIVHLCIPQLLQPLNLWNRDFLFEPEAPTISSVFSQFEIEKDEDVQGLDATLFQTIGIKAELPTAHYRSQVHCHKPPTKTLLCADPIHLEVGMNDITLTDKIIDLSDEESKALIEDLNKHFKQDGIAFIFGSNRHWYLALPEPEIVSTTPLDQALRQNIAQLLPQSEVRNWQIILNESQMILHASEVNQQREIAGLTTVNSLWFWGGGQVNERNDNDVGKAIKSIFYNNSEDSKILAKTMAKAAKCDCQILPDTDQLQKAVLDNNGKMLLILDQLFLPAIYDDLDQYQQALTKLDEDVFKPLQVLWQQGKIELILDGCDGKLIKAVKPSALKFWKKKSIALTVLAKQ